MVEGSPPFVGYTPNRLVSLSTGIIADASVNCDDAENIGLEAALHRNDKVKTMGDKKRL